MRKISIKSRMPPKVDVSILIEKRDSTIVASYELLEEFQVLYKVQSVLSTLKNVYKEMVIKNISLDNFLCYF